MNEHEKKLREWRRGCDLPWWCVDEIEWALDEIDRLRKILQENGNADRAAE